jgi:malonate-semialdehyde dehydrogenase (acetylating) / methylmalonate-semialdehyde dehydrogenase
MSVAELAVGTSTVHHWIGGELVASQSGRSGVVWNPATGEEQARVDFASTAEVDTAVAVAKRAFPAWRATAVSRGSDVQAA